MWSYFSVEVTRNKAHGQKHKSEMGWVVLGSPLDEVSQVKKNVLKKKRKKREGQAAGSSKDGKVVLAWGWKGRLKCRIYHKNMRKWDVARVSYDWTLERANKLSRVCEKFTTKNVKKNSLLPHIKACACVCKTDGTAVTNESAINH